VRQSWGSRSPIWLSPCKLLGVQASKLRALTLLVNRRAPQIYRGGYPARLLSASAVDRPSDSARLRLPTFVTSSPTLRLERSLYNGSSTPSLWPVRRCPNPDPTTSRAFPPGRLPGRQSLTLKYVIEIPQPSNVATGLPETAVASTLQSPGRGLKQKWAP
jgi:hypothetical protein